MRSFNFTWQQELHVWRVKSRVLAGTYFLSDPLGLHEHDYCSEDPIVLSDIFFSIIVAQSSVNVHKLNPTKFSVIHI